MSNIYDHTKPLKYAMGFAVTEWLDDGFTALVWSVNLNCIWCEEYEVSV